MVGEQIISSVVRIYPDGSIFGDPYEYCWYLLYHSMEEVEIIGVTYPPTLSQTRQLISLLRSKDIKVLLCSRRGRKIKHRLNKE